MLKDLMEDKQLDFNAPLLSVRRFASMAAVSSEGEKSNRIENSMHKIPTLPRYKPELKSGPVTNPGVVPFQWEQIPGRPKDGGGTLPRTLKRLPIAPKLPPGRILDAKQQPSITVSENSNIVPKTNNVLPSHKKFSSLDDIVSKLESSKEVLQEKGDSDMEDSVDDAFSDALETLSRNETFFLNCSVNGFSELDGSDMKPFSTDLLARDFMMGRFLPAAKAMASETPQYASRKKPVVREQQVSRDGRPPPYQCRPNIIPQFTQDKGEDDTEVDDDDYYDTRKLSAKACGLFPRLCLKNSFCLLNPVPEMTVRTQVPMSSMCKVGKQVKTTSAGSHSENDNENSWDAVYKHKLVSELQPPGLHEDESKQTSESNQFTYWSDSQTPDGSSSFRNSRGGSISPYWNEPHRSRFHEETGFLGIPKEVKDFIATGFDSYNRGHNNFQEMLSLEDSKQGLGSGSPVVEKTLYVDSVHLVENPNLNFNLSDTRELLDAPDKDLKVLVESKRIEELPLAESCLEDINNLHIPKERDILQSKMLVAVDANLLSSSNISKIRGNMNRVEALSLVQESSSLVCSKVPTDGNNDFDNSQPIKADNQGNFYAGTLQFPLTPPLPKSPSESWLQRTLPSVSSRNSYTRSYPGAQFHPKKQASKTSSVD